ncbi:MAG: FAD:protein FMN transferase [Angustibacter sp.]
MPVGRRRPTERHSEPLAAWGSTGSLLAPDAASARAAAAIAHRHLAAVTHAADRRLRRAEVHRVAQAAGAAVTLTPLLARMVRTAVDVAELTGGAVDPTVRPLEAPGQSAVFPRCGNASASRPRRSWRDLALDGHRLTAPGGTTLDLRATALASALDDIVLVAAQLLGADVEVRLGGRTARLGHGSARVRTGEVVDPSTGRRVTSPWSLVEVHGDSCLEASTAAVAAAVQGARAPELLRSLGVPARLVSPAGTPLVVGRADDPEQWRVA